MKINQETKMCNKCGVEKQLDDFISEKRNNCGKGYICKQCAKIKQKEYRKTKLGLINTIYDNQLIKSRKRNHNPPKYERKEFINWILNQPIFEELFNEWRNNNYLTDFVPSVDRLNNDFGYSFDNIRIVTWHENNHKEFNNKKNGINNNFSKSVLQFDMDMKLIREHYSIRNAARELNVSHGGIMRCCKLRQKYAYGFIWRYSKY